MNSRFSARGASILFTIIALVLGSYSLFQTKFTIGFFGLIHSLPITFFIALAFLTFAFAILWFSSENYEKLLTLQLCLLIAGLWIAPLAITDPYPFPSGNHPYMYLGATDYIIQNGHFSEKILYHEWPAAWMLCASIAKVLNISDFKFLIPLTPILLQFLYFPFLYIFFKNMLGKDQKNYCWAGVWLFYLGNWVGLHYLGAAGFSSLLFLIMLALLSKTSTWENRGVIGRRLSVILIFACLTITRILTSLVALAITTMLCIAKRIKSNTLPITFSVFIIVWTIYETTTFFEGELPRFIEHAFHLEILLHEGLAKPISAGSEAHQAIAKFRIIYSAMFATIGLSGAILGAKTKRSIYSDRTVLAMFTGVIILGVIMGISYGHSLLDSLFFYSLPFIGYFAVKLFTYKKTIAIIFCLLLLSFLPFHFICHYGNIAAEYITPKEISGAYFFHEHTIHGHVAGGNPVGYMKNQEHYIQTHLGQLRWESNALSYNGEIPYYIAVRWRDEARLEFAGGNPHPFRQAKNLLPISKNCNLFYTNPDLDLYICEGKLTK